jgi:hypothetical protein
MTTAGPGAGSIASSLTGVVDVPLFEEEAVFAPALFSGRVTSPWHPDASAAKNDRISSAPDLRLLPLGGLK